MIKKTLVLLLLSTPVYAVDTQSSINSADAYWAKKANHTSTTGVDNYMSSRPAQNTGSSSTEGSNLGANARKNYSDPVKTQDMLNQFQSGKGGMVDLAGNQASNANTTNYDVCLFNNPKSPDLCANDKASSDAYKLCKQQNPQTWETACASMAGALAAVDFRSGCSNSKEYIKLSYIPNAGTNDINKLVLEVDPYLTGTKTNVNPLPAPASGVCTNGIIACNAGTFTNCKYYKWVDTGGGIPGFQLTNNMAEIGGCYCVNKSCGSDLPFLNGLQILRDLSRGASAAMLRSVGEDTQITDSKLDNANLTITINAAKISECSGTAKGSTPNAQTSDPQVNNLTEMSDKMTNGTNTNDYLAEAGTSATTMSENTPDSQGTDISASGFSDPATKTQWKADYQTNGNNYLKLVKSANDITTSGVKELSCTIKKNYGINSVITNKSNSGVIAGCTDDGLGMRLSETNVSGTNYYDMTVWDTNKGHIVGNVIDGSTGKATTTYWAGLPLNTTMPGSLGRKLQQWTVKGNTYCNGTEILSSATGKSFNTDYTFPQTCGEYGVQCWTFSWEYSFDYVDDVASEGLTDGCAVLDADTTCQLKDETIDGVVTRSNYLKKGITPLPSSKIFTGQVTGSNTIWQAGWETKRTYLCKKDTPPNADINDITKRADSINKSTVFDSATGDIAFTDKAKDAKGNFVETARTDSLKVSVQSPGTCDMVCKVSKIAIDTQVRTQVGSTVDTTNPSKPQRTGVNILPVTGSGTGTAAGQLSAIKSYNFTYCMPNNPANLTTVGSDWTCPLKPDETIEHPCSCPDEFGESVGKIVSLIEAAKSVKCSKETSVPVP